MCACICIPDTVSLLFNAMQVAAYLWIGYSKQHFLNCATVITMFSVYGCVYLCLSLFLISSNSNQIVTHKHVINLN